MVCKLLFACTLCCLSLQLIAQHKDSLLTHFELNESLQNASISICVKDVSTGKTVMATNPQLSVSPASVMKIITTAAAFELLSDTLKFKTQLLANGEILNNHKLEGNLIIKGGGDPTLGSSYFFNNDAKTNFVSQWVHKLKANGIDTINGDIVADPTIFNEQSIPSTWIWEDIGNYYGAPANGLSVFDNRVSVFFSTGNCDGCSTKIIRTEPVVEGFELINKVKSSNKSGDNTIAYGSEFDNFREIRGTLPMGQSAFEVKVSIPNPPLVLVALLKKALADSAISVSGNIVVNSTEIDLRSAVVIAETYSPPLEEICKLTNHKSVNLYAEHLAKYIGLINLGDGSTVAGAKGIVDFWKSKSVDTKSMFMCDGSGMSRFNAITATSLVDILLYMSTQSRHAKSFEKTLPLAGLDGTMQNYFLTSPVKGKARLKTGSMTRVRSMAGYVYTVKGHKVAVAIMVNNYSGSSALISKAMERLIEGIYLNY